MLWPECPPYSRWIAHVPSWWNKKVPSQCLPKALHKSKHPLAPRWDSIGQTLNYSTFVVCWFMSELFSLLASSPHPSWSVLPCETGVTGLPQSLRLSWFSWCEDWAEALFVFEWRVKALGCVRVSKVLDVIQGWLGLLSSFWKMSCSTFLPFVAEVEIAWVRLKQPAATSFRLFWSLLIKEGYCMQHTAGVWIREGKGSLPSNEFDNSQFLTSLKP